MFLPRGCVAPLPLVLVLTLIALAAQTAACAQVGQTGQTGRVLQAQPRTLQPLLEKIAWDSAQRGPLLIVAPDKTVPLWLTRPMNVDAINISSGPKLPEPDYRGSYRLPDLGDYFGRRARTVGRSLTVFAPTTMTVLTSPLPKPDPYAGMGANEKLRLLQSLLTKTQWRTLGNPGGIGISDLDQKQRDLFLSLLPDPFVVQPVRRGDNGQRINYTGSDAKTDVTLTPAQRKSVRLSLHRVLNWSFTSAGNGSPGSTPARSDIRMGFVEDDGASYEIRGNGFGSNSPGRNGTLFGVPLLTEVPSQLKPGHLPFISTALDVPISLEGAATVGDLIKRTAAQTRVPLYCDPRYAGLSVYIRNSGRSVRAGDLLQALCWAVTGTFRKVGAGIASSFVLTDDVEGLGTRHARLQAWASTNAALGEQRRNEVDEALAKAPVGDSVGWAAGDPQHPDESLAQKIEDHRKKISDPNKPPATNTNPSGQGAQPSQPLLIVPVSELPSTAQETVRRQLEDYAKILENEKSNDFIAEHPEVASPALQPDRVVMDVQVQASFFVPGIGTVSAQGISVSSAAVQRLSPVSLSSLLGQIGSIPAQPLPTHVAVPAAYKQSALLVSARNADEATRAVTAAKRHGLNQVWIEVPIVPEALTALPGPDGAEDRSGRETLLAGIAAGKNANVLVGAVVRLLRDPSGAAGAAAGSAASASFSYLSSDRNIVGETTTTFASRRAAVPFIALPFMRPALTPPEEAKRLLRLGDWLQPDQTAVQAAARNRVASITEMPGLAGLMLRDVAAPGYDGTGGAGASPFDALDGGEQMGYTEEMRLAFLREAGIDPVDLSPLPQGMLALPYSFGGGYSPFQTMQLPFFTDYGMSPGNLTIYNQNALELGAKDGMERWQRFRIARTEALVQSVIQSIHTRQPDLPVWVQRGGDAFSGFAQTPVFGTAEAVVSGVSAVSAVSRAATIPPATTSSATAPKSPQTLLVLRCPPLSEATTVTDMGVNGADDFTRSLAGVMTRPASGWQGLVIDLSEVSLDRALPLLDILKPSPTSSPLPGK
ncbi:MAG: hypothetical protein V4671_12085 [Armatimonadota bacterium]